jgi:hypothetical protein
MVASALRTSVGTRCPFHGFLVSNEPMGIRLLTTIIMGSSYVLAQENASAEFDPIYVDGPLGPWHTVLVPAVSAAILYAIWRFLRWRVARQHRDRRLAYWFPTAMIVVGSGLVWVESGSLFPPGSTSRLISSVSLSVFGLLNFPVVFTAVLLTERLPPIPAWLIGTIAGILVWSMWHAIIRLLEHRAHCANTRVSLTP